MTDVRGLLIKLLEQYKPERKYEMGSSTGHKCSWCGVVVGFLVFDDPDQHDAHCLYRAALEWRKKEEN